MGVQVAGPSTRARHNGGTASCNTYDTETAPQQATHRMSRLVVQSMPLKVQLQRRSHHVSHPDLQSTEGFPLTCQGQKIMRHISYKATRKIWEIDPRFHVRLGQALQARLPSGLCETELEVAEGLGKCDSTSGGTCRTSYHTRHVLYNEFRTRGPVCRRSQAPHVLGVVHVPACMYVAPDGCPPSPLTQGPGGCDVCLPALARGA
jgi:hypothetical protein